MKMVTSDSQLHPRAWLVVGLLWFVVFSNYLARLLPTTMHDSLVSAIPMTEAQFGLLTAAFLWVYGLMSPFGGFLADRFSRSRVIITSMFAWSLITWLSSYARTYQELLILRILMSLAEACYMPTALALISDYHKGSTRSLATGIQQSGYVAGIGLTGIGGWLAERYSWHYAFSLVGLVSVAYCALLPFLLRDAPRENSTGIVAAETKPNVRIDHAFVSVFRCGPFVLVFIVSALSGFVGWPISGWMPVYLREHFHLTQTVAGFTATVYMNAAAIPGLIIGGVWADQWSRTNRRSRMFIPAIGIFIASTGILLVANISVLILAVLGLVIFRLFYGFVEANAMPMLCEIVDSRYRATAYGLINMMAAAGGGLGIYYSGVLRDLKVDLHIVFDVLAVVAVLCALMFYLVKPQTPEATRQPP